MHRFKISPTWLASSRLHCTRVLLLGSILDCLQISTGKCHFVIIAPSYDHFRRALIQNMLRALPPFHGSLQFQNKQPVLPGLPKKSVICNTFMNWAITLCTYPFYCTFVCSVYIVLCKISNVYIKMAQEITKMQAISL